MDENQLREFEEQIGMLPDPKKDALAALKAHQQAMGLTFENPDAPVAPDAKSIAAAEDEEIGGTWMGGPRRGR